jgi:hypothetical protein
MQINNYRFVLKTFFVGESVELGLWSAGFGRNKCFFLEVLTKSSAADFAAINNHRLGLHKPSL